jgi:ATP phosphoribosyltransferase regulatory subunit
VLHARPAADNARRELLQLGAELFGHPSVQSDIEVQQLMLRALSLAGIGDVHLDLGHVGVFRALVARAGIEPTLESALFAALQGKDVSEVHALTAAVAAPWREALRRLPDLYGDRGVLEAAARELPPLPEVRQALEALAAMADATAPGSATLHFDLAELRGYHYHSGVVFAAYTAGHATAIAAGGRYDEVGRAFGRARPATGFSLDLVELSTIIGTAAVPGAVLAPSGGDPGLLATIDALRAAGEVVVVDLPGEQRPVAELNCSRALVQRDGRWQVQALPDSPDAPR